MQRRTLIGGLGVAGLGLAALPTARAQTEAKGPHQAVLAATASLFASVESLDVPAFQGLLSPQMAGLAQLRDAVALLMASEQQIRYALSETSVQPSGEAFLVKTRWERRFLLPGGPQVHWRGGTTTLTFELVEGRWRLAALAGESPFEHSPRK